jgi:hypothetical protein
MAFNFAARIAMSTLCDRNRFTDRPGADLEREDVTRFESSDRVPMPFIAHVLVLFGRPNGIRTIGGRRTASNQAGSRLTEPEATGNNR